MATNRIRAERDVTCSLITITPHVVERSDRWFLADRTVIGYWHCRMSVCMSVCTVAKRYIL